MTALRTLRRAHDRLVICAETSEDWALVREMDAAIEQVAEDQADRDGLHKSLSITLEELIAANRYGEMPHPVCQDDED